MASIVKEGFIEKEEPKKWVGFKEKRELRLGWDGEWSELRRQCLKD